MKAVLVFTTLLIGLSQTALANVTTQTHDLSCYARANFITGLVLHYHSREVYDGSGDFIKYGLSQATLDTYIIDQDGSSKNPARFTDALTDIYKDKNIDLSLFTDFKSEHDVSLTDSNSNITVILTANASDVKQVSLSNPVGGTLFSNYNFNGNLVLTPTDGSTGYNGPVECQEGYNTSFIMTGLSPFVNTF